MSDMDFQLQKRRHFNWLSGDIIDESVHSVDKMNWAMNRPAGRTTPSPVAVSEGRGRGDVFDHFAVIYEWDNGGGFLCPAAARLLERQ